MTDIEPWVVTVTGRRVNIFALRPEDIDIEDIAHGLACFNRFCGQALYPISVAHHSVMVARVAAALNGMKGTDTRRSEGDRRRQGLLHDAFEAYGGDVTRWLKRTEGMAAYREAERVGSIAIYRRFGCATQDHAEVKDADNLVVRWEIHHGYGARWNPGAGALAPMHELELRFMTRFCGEWTNLTWQDAKQEFLNEFARTGGDR